MRYAWLVLAVVAATAANARSQSGEANDWANKLFAQTSHDFKTVPRGIQLKHTFYMKNIYNVPLEITNLRVSCGCVTATPSKKSLEPNETGEIDILMDARRFSGQKLITIDVTVGPKWVSTARLQVTANARSDVALNPGTVNFGVVPRGQSPMQTVDVEYSGAMDWRIQEVVKNASAPIQVKVDEIRREEKGGGGIFGAFRKSSNEVGYRFYVTLNPNAPTGAFKEELILKTNDPSSPVMMIPVEGQVQATLAVAPRAINVGSLQQGEVVTRKVVLRGSRAFRILNIDGEGDGISATAPTTFAPSHIVVLRCEAKQVGQVHREIIIRTDLDQEYATVTVDGTVQ